MFQRGIMVGGLPERDPGKSAGCSAACAQCVRMIKRSNPARLPKSLRRRAGAISRRDVRSRVSSQCLVRFGYRGTLVP